MTPALRTALLAAALALAACAPKPPPRPGPLKAGVATVKLDAPVGVAMGGYGRLKASDTPGSPYADALPNSRGIQTQPTARAVALTDGLKTVVLVRMDLALTVAPLRFRAEALLKERGADATLWVASTHTHAGPARYFRPTPVDGTGGTDPTVMAMDAFDVEQEERLAGSIADAAVQALADLRPVSVGHATVDGAAFNADRRCANDDLYGPNYTDKTLTVIRLDEVDAQGTPVKPLTGFVHFAMHGTVLGPENTLMSVDAPGMMELYASDAVGVPLVYLQGSAGDVAPNPGGTGLEDFQALEHLGRASAPLVAQAFAQAAPGAQPKEARLVRYELPVDLSRAAIGYALREFPEYGGIGCGLGAEHCPPIASAPNEIFCAPLKKRPFSQTTVLALQLEDLLLVTLPGEPTTAIGARIKALGAGVPGVSQTMVVGYSQDHYGYILEEPDFLRLGYEPTVSPWGWKFGDFIVGKAGEAVAGLGKSSPVALLPEALPVTRHTPQDGLRAPAQDGAVADLQRLGTAVFHFAGGDPGLGTPELLLEREEGQGFVTVMAGPLRPVTGGPELLLRYDAKPTVKAEPMAAARDHLWTVEWETLADTRPGRYRFTAHGQAQLGGARAPYELHSNAFTLSAATSAGAGATGTLAASGALAVTFRFPPNPPLRNANGEAVGNYRLRDLDADPRVGAPVQGGAAAATVQYPDATTDTATLTWSDAAQAYTATVRGLAGTTTVRVAAGGLTDGKGNSNGAPLSLAVTR